MSAIRILVADDNRDCVQSLARLLRLLGHEVLTADSGEAALAQAQRTPPELILLDIGMPGMNGYDVVQRLREDPETRSATIVALSGLSAEEYRQRAVTAGFDGYLTKPVSLATLEKLVPQCQVTGG